MKKINYWRILISGIVGGIVFMVMEFFVESLILGGIWGIREHDIFKEAFGHINTGGWYQVVNIAILFVEFILIMWVYAALRPRFATTLKTALITALLFYVMFLLFAVNLVNLGILPIKVMAVSLGANLIELPFAVFVGASVYPEE